MLLAISAGHVLTQHWLLVLKKEVYYFLTERVSAKFLASQNTAKRLLLETGALKAILSHVLLIVCLLSQIKQVIHFMTVSL